MAGKNKNENPPCIKCGCKTTKHGRRNQKQRYRCKKCHLTFYDPNEIDYKYQRNTKRILSLLFCILENDFFKKDDLEEALYSTKEYYKHARKVQFNTKYVKDYTNKKDLKIDCYQPKLLICQDDKNITFIQIPSPTSTNKNYKRTITIHDNFDAGHGHSFQIYNKSLIKDK